ncbi:MAG: HEAT repeat domain-containing protein [Sandaracinaceae bacterium]|nr:HEAT repeat domain-containing protein [Sandaracinaceae bacterium]
MDGRAIQRELEAERVSPEDALSSATSAAHAAATSAARIEACRVIGALAGRAHGASWETAERAAFVLLEIARDTDAPAERAALLWAMGRSFRNAWLMPYVHARLGDEDELVLCAAIGAAGGLALPALEEAIASFLDDSRASVRGEAIAALGRMGARSAAERLASCIGGADAAPALAALTEIRARAGIAAALELLAHEPRGELLTSAVRYLAELGVPAVLPVLRRMARDEDAEKRIAASLASRALRAETSLDADERILAALTERDRAVRALLARRLRTLPVESVLEHAELLLADDPEGVVQVLAEVRAPEVTRRLLALAADETAVAAVRARAAGSIEADEPWERDALVELVERSSETAVRVAAAQTLGAFAPPSLVIERLGSVMDDPSPALRGALLWAIQLSARPRALGGSDRPRAEALVARALSDPDPGVRRRAAYVAGNLHAASLVPALCDLVRGEEDRADLRIAGFVALAEIGSPERGADLVHLFQREDDPGALGAAARRHRAERRPDRAPPRSAREAARLVGSARARGRRPRGGADPRGARGPARRARERRVAARARASRGRARPPRRPRGGARARLGPRGRGRSHPGARGHRPALARDRRLRRARHRARLAHRGPRRGRAHRGADRPPERGAREDRRSARRGHGPHRARSPRLRAAPRAEGARARRDPTGRLDRHRRGHRGAVPHLAAALARPGVRAARQEPANGGDALHRHDRRRGSVRRHRALDQVDGGLPARVARPPARVPAGAAERALRARRRRHRERLAGLPPLARLALDRPGRRGRPLRRAAAALGRERAARALGSTPQVARLSPCPSPSGRASCSFSPSITRRGRATCSASRTATRSAPCGWRTASSCSRRCATPSRTAPWPAARRWRASAPSTTRPSRSSPPWPRPWVIIGPCSRGVSSSVPRC